MTKEFYSKVYHGMLKGNGQRASGYYSMHFETSEDVPKCISKIMRKFNDVYFKNRGYEITIVKIDYKLKMISVKYLI